MEKFDLVVIGGGPGGYPAAIRAAQLGASVALVEKEALGGTCLNWGCIPTKTLIASSDLYAHMQHSDKLGISATDVVADYKTMTKRKDKVVATLNGGVAQLLKANGVTVLSGVASFASRNTISVSLQDGATTMLQANNTIIATGASPAMPGFLPKSELVMTSRQFLALTSLPDSIIVLGGGVIGCEFACMAAQLGSEVTIVEMLDDILIILDKDVRTVLRSHMEKDLGIRVLTGKPLQDIKADATSVSGKFDRKKIKADVLLAAIGRRPFTDKLNLAAAGLTTNDAGFIETDDTCRTAVATVYAIGDVSGEPQLAHAATSQGITAAENACGPARRTVETAVPACIFTSPEIGCAGLTEQQATEQGIDYKVGKFSFASLGKAMATGETNGFLKILTDTVTGRILGAQSIGPHATELISEAALAIRSEITVEELAATIHCHPTLSEAWMEAAHAAEGTCVHAPPKRKR